MPTFEFTVSKDVKVEAPDQRTGAAVLRNEYPLLAKKPYVVGLGVLGEATVTESSPRITAKRERKAKKAPETLAAEARLAELMKKSEEKPPQSEVKDACYLCCEDILPGQPIHIINKDGISYTVHSVCAAAGGVT